MTDPTLGIEMGTAGAALASSRPHLRWSGLHPLVRQAPGIAPASIDPEYAP